MKKLLIITLAALTLAACSEQSKAERKAKAYLETQSNDGKIEIVEYGNLVDFTYSFDPTTSKQNEAQIYLDSYRKSMRDFEITNDPLDLEFAKKFAFQADSIIKLTENIKPIDCPLKSIDVTFRAKNKLGATVKDNATVYFAPDFSDVSLNPEYVIPDSIYQLRNNF